MSRFATCETVYAPTVEVNGKNRCVMYGRPVLVSQDALSHFCGACGKQCRLIDVAEKTATLVTDQVRRDPKVAGMPLSEYVDFWFRTMHDGGLTIKPGEAGGHVRPEGQTSEQIAAGVTGSEAEAVVRSYGLFMERRYGKEFPWQWVDEWLTEAYGIRRRR